MTYAGIWKIDATSDKFSSMIPEDYKSRSYDTERISATSANGPRRRKGKRGEKLELIREIRNLYAQGYSLQEIATNKNLSYSKTWRYLNSNCESPLTILRESAALEQLLDLARLDKILQVHMPRLNATGYGNSEISNANRHHSVAAARVILQTIKSRAKILGYWDTHTRK
jgi:hypothetical protein